MSQFCTLATTLQGFLLIYGENNMLWKSLYINEHKKRFTSEEKGISQEERL